MAVTMFMVISGYLYAKSFESKRIDSFKKAYELKSIVEKMLRFTIPFLGAFILEVLCIFIAGNSSKYNYVSLFLQGG